MSCKLEEYKGYSIELEDGSGDYYYVSAYLDKACFTVHYAAKTQLKLFGTYSVEDAVKYRIQQIKEEIDLEEKKGKEFECLCKKLKGMQ